MLVSFTREDLTKSLVYSERNRCPYTYSKGTIKVINLYIYIYIYVGDERTPEPSLWNFGKTPSIVI